MYSGCSTTIEPKHDLCIIETISHPDNHNRTIAGEFEGGTGTEFERVPTNRHSVLELPLLWQFP